MGLNKIHFCAAANLVDPDGSLVNFQDLTRLLASWTVAEAAGEAPQAAAIETNARRDTSTTESRTATNAHFDRLGRRDRATLRRDRRTSGLSTHDSPLRRLQAAAVDRAMGDRAESTLARGEEPVQSSR